MARLIYLTHPEVAIDPAVPVPEWRLSGRGRARTERLAASPRLASVTHIFASAETKAREAAAIIAAARGLEVRLRTAMGEIDRSATGFLTPPAFERAADAFFAAPADSHRGWERAVDAQARILAATDAALAEADGEGAGHVLLVGHGAVGTLLMCALAGLPIARRHDQPAGGGNIFSYDRAGRRLLHRWVPIESWIGQDP